MLKIEVTGKTRTMKSKAGDAFQVQEAFVHLPGVKYPQQIELMPPKGQQPYAEGEYMLAPESFYVGEYKALEIRPQLVPIKGVQSKAA